MKKKYLITGGLGFIGTNFTEKLSNLGNDVYILDNLSSKGARENLNYLKNKCPNLNFTHHDLRCNSANLNSLVDKVDIIFHLAAQVAVTTSLSNPRDDFEVNALGTLNLLEAIRNSESKPGIIYASTNKVYGGLESLQIREDKFRYDFQDIGAVNECTPLDFHSPYGCSKGSADQYVRDYSRIYGIKSVVMRQSCIYGKRQFGAEDQGWVAWFIIALLTGKPITIYGNGKQVRDILYVDDLFDAWLQASECIDEISGSIFNIGGGPEMSISLLEFLEHLKINFGLKAEPSFAEVRPGDQPIYISDISKIKSVIGWYPKTNPSRGINELVAWATQNKEIFD